MWNLRKSELKKNNTNCLILKDLFDSGASGPTAAKNLKIFFNILSMGVFVNTFLQIFMYRSETNIEKNITLLKTGIYQIK